MSKIVVFELVTLDGVAELVFVNITTTTTGVVIATYPPAAVSGKLNTLRSISRARLSPSS